VTAGAAGFRLHHACDDASAQLRQRDRGGPGRRSRDLLCESLIGLGCLPEDATEFARESFAISARCCWSRCAIPAELPAEYLNERGEYCWGRSRLMQRVGKQAASSAATRHFATPSRDFA
jgi:hypothetical protein